MMNHLRPALVLITGFTLVLGAALPAGFSAAAALVFPDQATGSFVLKDGKPVGSALIGQAFTSDKYFWPRPSALTGTDPKDPNKHVATPYDASESGASNLAPTAQALIDRVKADAPKYGPAPVPADAVLSSGSGLDPDISPENAARQAGRVARARHLDESRVLALVAANTEGRTLGVFGEPRVNVLKLNLALDAMR